MAYGWEAWKNRAIGNAAHGRSRQAKERGYLRGFKHEGKTLALDPDVIASAICPHSVLDDPGIDAGGAYDLGRLDAKAAGRARKAAGRARTGAA